MGWLFAYNTNKKQMIAERTNNFSTQGWNTKHNLNPDRKSSFTIYIIGTCLKHCYRGNRFSGVLWTVWEYEIHDLKTDELISTDNWIGCDLLKYDKSCSGWGYKDMEESMHPYQYSCPLGYLELAPEKNAEWRKGVRKYHEIRNRKYQTGELLKLNASLVPYVEVINVKPLRGLYEGKVYRIPNSLIDRVITPEELQVLKENNLLTV
jgi:hypothetical protein